MILRRKSRSHLRHNHNQSPQKWDRIRFIRFILVLASLAVVLRLFNIQVINKASFKAAARDQYQSTSKIIPQRGNILTSDRFPLATSISSFLLFADPPLVKDNLEETLTPILFPDATPSALKIEAESIKEKLSQKDLHWVSLKSDLSIEQKDAVENLQFEGLGFETGQLRYYPEASLAAQLVGFVGKDEFGRDKGYFGLEGYYDLELSGREGETTEEIDLLGLPIVVGKNRQSKSSSGRHLLTSIDRAAQFIVEQKLKTGLEKYGAKSGTVTIMDPQSGKILSLASFPSYDPAGYEKESPELFKNPVIAAPYEPGSTFKVLVMAAALEEKAVEPDTVCTRCSGPLQLDKYVIRTWNNEYNSNSTMTDVIVHSDNTGMVFAGDHLGTEKFLKYFHEFGFSSPTGIDLEEEVVPSVRSDNEWSYIDRSTASFGQGIAVTPIQMVRAVGAIANKGKLLKPRVVEKIIDQDREIQIKSASPVQVISEKTAQQITSMMVKAVEEGEAKWAKPEEFLVAGKTGTAQIPISGHYDEEKTIASFVGFAPALNPRFVMLVTLTEPQSSPWGSETAAPLWFSIANDLFRLWNISP